MTHEEQLARTYAPVLSIGHYIYETDRLPSVGDQWTVEAEVADFGAAKGWPPSIKQFAFKVEISRDLLLSALSLAQTMQDRSCPVWYRRVGSLAIGIKASFSDSFETTSKDLRRLIRRLDHMLDEGKSRREERWVLAYLDIYWAPLIPAQGNADYYLGETHGLRTAIDYFEMRYPALQNGDERILLGVVLVGLAALSAERHAGRQPRLGVGRYAAEASSIPPRLLIHTPTPILIDDAEAASLAAIESGESASVAAPPLDPGFLLAASHFIPTGRGAAFYEGLLHGLYLSLQVVMVFHDVILSHPDDTMHGWEEVLLRFAGVAARHRLGLA